MGMGVPSLGPYKFLGNFTSGDFAYLAGTKKMPKSVSRMVLQRYEIDLILPGVRRFDLFWGCYHIMECN